MPRSLNPLLWLAFGSFAIGLLFAIDRRRRALLGKMDMLKG